MNDFLAAIAILVFCLSSYLVYDLLVNGFNLYVLLGAIVGYTFVHFIWPRTRDNASAWYDLLEYVCDFPYRAIAFSLRTMFSKSGKGDVDLDV